MIDLDNKDVATVALMIIALATIYFTKTDGLSVVSNVVCAIGGIATGKILSKP